MLNRYVIITCLTKLYPVHCSIFTTLNLKLHETIKFACHFCFPVSTIDTVCFYGMNNNISHLFCVPCLDPLVYLLPKTFKLFDLPILWLWAYQMNVIPDTSRYLHFIRSKCTEQIRRKHFQRVTNPFFVHRILTWVTRRVQLVEQEIITLSEHLSALPASSWDRVVHLSIYMSSLLFSSVIPAKISTEKRCSTRFCSHLFCMGGSIYI